MKGIGFSCAALTQDEKHSRTTSRTFKFRPCRRRRLHTNTERRNTASLSLLTRNDDETITVGRPMSTTRQVVNFFVNHGRSSQLALELRSSNAIGAKLLEMAVWSKYS